LAADQSIFLATGILMVFIGIAAVSTSKNLIKTMMAFQVVVFGVSLALFSTGLATGARVLSDEFVLMAVLAGASVESLGLAIIVTVYRKYGTLDPSKIRRLRG
jgi:multicomponent Na+:H+ antiporter subunit C